MGTGPSGIEGFAIRRAEERDVRLILWFIKGLADYERLSHEVTANEEGLREHLFGPAPKAEVIFAEFRDEPVGFALFFHNFSTFMGKPGIYLEDLYIVPEMRGRGFGKALLVYLARLAVERGCGRLEWAVLDWNQPAIDFYDSLGARLMKEWIINRLTGEKLLELSMQK
jgi:GNAT superfamily N-acetyltransferase